MKLSKMEEGRDTIRFKTCHALCGLSREVKLGGIDLVKFEVKRQSASLRVRVMSTITSAKVSLRKKVANVLNNLHENDKKRQSEALFKKLTVLPQYIESKRISIFLSTDNEVDTLPVLKDIFAKGKEAFIPRYRGKKMQMVKLYSMTDFDQLPLTKWNIKQPDSNEIREDALETGGLDLVILPGVAFTSNGKRLGHGMGYYDKYLGHVKENFKRMPYLVALSFNEQIQPDIPTDEKDFLIDLVLTEENSFQKS